MVNEYLAEIHPERCAIYGPRLWIKFHLADVYGTKSETELYRSIRQLACHGGPDREYRHVDQAISDDDLQIILCFEFPCVTPRKSDTMETLAMRRRYHEACLLLLHAGYIQREDSQNEEFFHGYYGSTL